MIVERETLPPGSDGKGPWLRAIPAESRRDHAPRTGWFIPENAGSNRRVEPAQANGPANSVLRMNRRKLVIALAAAVLVVAGTAVGGYALGRSSIDTGRIRRSNQAAVERSYRVGYVAGAKAQIDAAATKEATLRARADRAARRGRDLGYRDGWNAVFDGFDGWSPGYYVVQLEHGDENGLDFQITSRLTMEHDQAYTLCADGPGVCGGPIP